MKWSFKTFKLGSFLISEGIFSTDLTYLWTSIVEISVELGKKFAASIFDSGDWRAVAIVGF